MANPRNIINQGFAVGSLNDIERLLKTATQTAQATPNSVERGIYRMPSTDEVERATRDFNSVTFPENKRPLAETQPGERRYSLEDANYAKYANRSNLAIIKHCGSLIISLPMVEKEDIKDIRLMNNTLSITINTNSPFVFNGKHTIVLDSTFENVDFSENNIDFSNGVLKMPYTQRTGKQFSIRVS